MLRARASAAVQAARQEFQMRRAERREHDALACAGELIATSELSPTNSASQALLVETQRRRLELEGHCAAVTHSLEADRADYVAVAPWMRPLVILRGLCARAVLHHRMTRGRRELRSLHQRLGAAERTGPLGPVDGGTLPPWLRWISEEARAFRRALVKQLEGQLFPRASALAGLAAGWWVAHTFTDSRPRSLLRSIGIGHGGTHVVSGATYRVLSFWLPILVAALSAYLGDRIARRVRRRGWTYPV